MNIPTDISAYAGITALLDPYIEGILAGRYMEAAGTLSYNPSLPCPDFERTLAEKLAKPVSAALQKNLYILSQEITSGVTPVLKALLDSSWDRSGGFWYPARNGFMDWHTNHTTPGARIYLVWCREGGKSRFLYSPDGGKTIIAPYEPAGWSVNVFMLEGAEKPFWHAVDSGGTDRISFGFKRTEYSASRMLQQKTALFQCNVKK